MANKKLDARTLRAVARQLRKTQRQCFESMRGFEKRTDIGSRESAQFFRGFACSALHAADALLSDARAIERSRRSLESTPRKKARKA